MSDSCNTNLHALSFQAMKEVIRKQWYGLGIVCIVLTASILRFVNYPNRFGLAYDQAHDAVIARYALITGQIPLVGPFSSAGPFQTGGEWYWIIMVGQLLYFPSILTPWVFIGLLYVVFVYLMIKAGELFINKRFGLIAGALAAVSPAQITQSTNLTNQSPEAIMGLLVFVMSILYIRTQKKHYIFWLAFCISFAAAIHLQGAMLMAIFVVTCGVVGFRVVRHMGYIMAGFYLPITPILVFDTYYNYVTAKGFLKYFLHDQYKVTYEELGRRWLTYLFEFIPREWGFIVGGFPLMGGLIIILIATTGVYALYKKLVSRELIVLFTSLSIMMVLMRYVRTPIFASYMVYLHGLVILAVSWSLYTLALRFKRAGLGIIGLVIVVTLVRSTHEIYRSENSTAPQVSRFRDFLIETYPGQKFSLYDHRLVTSNKTMPLVLYLFEKDIVEESGMKIGLSIEIDKFPIDYPVVYGKNGGYQLFDLSAASDEELSLNQWFPLNPKEIYDSTEFWPSR